MAVEQPHEWTPAHSLAETDAILTAPGMLLETQRVLVNGQLLRTFKNIPQSLRSFWLNCVRDYGPKPYIVFEEQALTYAETHERASVLASVLREKYHLRRGDRVAIAMRNCPNWIVTWWACHLLGAVTALVNSWLPPKPFLHCLTHVSAKVVVVDVERFKLLEPHLGNFGSGRAVLLASTEAPGKAQHVHNVPSIDGETRHYHGPRDAWKKEPECTLDDNATIFFTSGTTGLPKGALSTQRSFMHGYMMAVYGRDRALVRRGMEPWGAPTPDSTAGMLLAIPLFHVSGTTSNLMTYTYQGMKLGLIRKWDKEAAVAFMLKHNLTVFGGVPTQLFDLLDSSLRGRRFLQQLSYGGAPTPPGMNSNIANAFPGIMMGQGYGLTETNAGVINLAVDDYLQRPRSAGVPPPVNEVIIVDVEKGRECAPGAVGEIWVRGTLVMKEYWRDPEATAQAMSRDGWFKTGDLAYADEDGFIYIVDRAKDIIIRGGENIQSVSVEDAIYADTRVAEVAAIAVPDKRLGELVSVVVVPKAGTTISEDEVVAVAKRTLPHFAVPVMAIVQRNPLPRNAGGKVMKPDVRKVAAAEWTKRNARKHKAKL